MEVKCISTFPYNCSAAINRYTCLLGHIWGSCSKVDTDKWNLELLGRHINNFVTYGQSAPQITHLKALRASDPY